MIKTVSIRNLKTDDFDEVWIIVRSAKKLNANLLANAKVKHVPVLSPSYNLFVSYLNWAKAGEWNKEKFRNEYARIFLREMRSHAAKAALKLLAAKAAWKNIALVCFCPDKNTSHRTLVAEILEREYGVKVINE